MDFIKTSSLRALIELTFQRNWNGLIWMSRKGVIQKSEDCPDGSIEKRAGWPRNEFPRSAKVIRPSLPKPRPITHTTRETSRGRPSSTSRQPRTTSRASREKPRGRATRVPRPMRVRPGKPSHVRPKHRPNLHPPTTAADHESSGHDRSDAATMTRCPADRPDRPSNAAVDPKPVLKPVSYFQARLNPKPPRRPSTIYILFSLLRKRAALVFRFPTLSFIAIMFSSSLCVFALIMSE
ncbi:unnamed protein product [Microthlaspi erraticum]|uniref:Uncharacterized protein n=1 Tax=Microthlaspi erraticum TaxID=1685480 RepID=A0A6D2L139_9BRAS|nr:unnamed protein product [Microthlaspi erraticum]